MANEQKYRVAYGWSRYEDFHDAAHAVTFAATIGNQPTSDPSLRHVAILDLESPSPYSTIIEFDRPER